VCIVGNPELAINGLGGHYSPQVGLALQFEDQMAPCNAASIPFSRHRFPTDLQKRLLARNSFRLVPEFSASRHAQPFVCLNIDSALKNTGLFGNVWL